MRKRGPRWTLEPGRFPCACGAEAAILTNQRSGEQKLLKHKQPDGKTCAEWLWQQAVDRTRRICEEAGVPC